MQESTIAKPALILWQICLIVLLFLFLYTALTIVQQLYRKELVDFYLYIPPLLIFAVSLYLFYLLRRQVAKLRIKAALYSFGITLVAATLLSIFTVKVADHYKVEVNIGGLKDATAKSTI